MLNKKLTFTGDLQIGESEGGFLPASILVGRECLDVLIAKALNESEADETRPHALEHGIVYAGHCMVTVEPVSLVCCNCGSAKLMRDEKTYTCVVCDHTFRHGEAKQVRFMVAGDVEDRTTFIPFFSDEDRQEWESVLETNLETIGGMFINYHGRNGTPKEVYFTDSTAPHAADRLYPYQIEVVQTDQYGEILPYDLVVMPRHEWINEELRDKILTEVDWYDCGGVLLVSAKAVDYASEDDPADVGLDIVRESVNRVAYSLKRYNEIDGFYNA